MYRQLVNGKIMVNSDAKRIDVLTTKEYQHQKTTFKYKWLRVKKQLGL